jgi:hypothetical protein
MKGLQMMLKALGINIPETDVKAIEELLPKIPGIVKEGIVVVNNALQNYDVRLKALETEMQLQRKMLQEVIDGFGHRQLPGADITGTKQPNRKRTNGTT